MNWSHPAVAGAISCVMVIVAMVFSDVVLGMGVLVPILDNFVEARRATVRASVLSKRSPCSFS